MKAHFADITSASFKKLVCLLGSLCGQTTSFPHRLTGLHGAGWCRTWRPLQWRSVARGSVLRTSALPECLCFICVRLICFTEVSVDSDRDSVIESEDEEKEPDVRGSFSLPFVLLNVMNKSSQLCFNSSQMMTSPRRRMKVTIVWRR